MEPELLLTWTDIAMGLVLLASFVVGAVRGFVFEAFSLAGWLVAYLVSPLLAPTVRAWLPSLQGGGNWQGAASIVLAFVLVLLVMAVAARLMRALLHSTPLKAADRLLGSGFGLLRGVLLCLLIGMLIAVTPLRGHPSWTESQARPLLAGMLRALGPLLPPDLRRLFERSVGQHHSYLSGP